MCESDKMNSSELLCFKEKICPLDKFFIFCFTYNTVGFYECYHNNNILAMLQAYLYAKLSLVNL